MKNLADFLEKTVRDTLEGKNPKAIVIPDSLLEYIKSTQHVDVEYKNKEVR